jgi:glycyl-tRNA synthetase (class II)
LGSVLKENIKNLWIKNFVQKRKDMVLLDAAILMNPQVWVASGHVGGFSDPLIDDKNTKERFRADKLLEDLIEEKLTQTKADFQIISNSTASNDETVKSSSFGKRFMPLVEKLTSQSAQKYNNDFKILYFEDL